MVTINAWSVTTTITIALIQQDHGAMQILVVLVRDSGNVHTSRTHNIVTQAQIDVSHASKMRIVQIQIPYSLQLTQPTATVKMTTHVVSTYFYNLYVVLCAIQMLFTHFHSRPQSIYAV